VWISVLLVGNFGSFGRQSRLLSNLLLTGVVNSQGTSSSSLRQLLNTGRLEENLIYGPICLEIESLLTTKKPFEEITFTPYAKPAEDELVKIVSKISTTPLISEEVATLINFVSAHSSTNYSAKILQGKETFNDLEASNLLLVEDRYGNTISDYLISCINKYSTADKFTTTSALLAALCNGVDGARRSTPEYAAHSRAPQP